MQYKQVIVLWELLIIFFGSNYLSNLNCVSVIVFWKFSLFF